MMKRPKPPCRNCEDRWVSKTTTCHATCERYIEYCRLNELWKQEMEKQKMIYPEKVWYQTSTGWWRKK